MKKYDYSFLKDIKIPSSFLKLTNTIYSLKTEATKNQKEYPKIFSNLEKNAIIQSVKASNAIEGIITTDKRLNEILNKNANPITHSEKEIIGYKEALNMIHTNYEFISFNIETIKKLHRIMLEYSELTSKGEFKKEDNIIFEKHSDGEVKIRFIPVKACKTNDAMEALINAFIIARDDCNIDKLLLIPCLILDFLCIHPFQDGNGRVSRLLTLLLLYRFGFDIAKYISFEEKINLIKSNYYQALRDSSNGWHENNNDYIPFIENFLHTLYLCYKDLDKRFLTIKDGKVSKRKRIEEIILSSLIPISKQEISNLAPDISITTIEIMLLEMLKDKKIIKIGTTKNVKYIKNLNF